MNISHTDLKLAAYTQGCRDHWRLWDLHGKTAILQLLQLVDLKALHQQSHVRSMFSRIKSLHKDNAKSPFLNKFQTQIECLAYAWRVRANDLAGDSVYVLCSSWSLTFSFFVKPRGSNAPPGYFLFSESGSLFLRASEPAMATNSWDNGTGKSQLLLASTVKEQEPLQVSLLSLPLQSEC